jgi:CBS domain-containing protein
LRKIPFLGLDIHIHAFRIEQEVAVPTERTVRGLEALAETITSLPPLLTVASKTVRTCRPSEPVGAAARVMHDNSFSQLPVHDGEKLMGLLTGETIARWLAARLEVLACVSRSMKARTAHIENFPEPIHFGIHGGIKQFYKEKYGREITGPEYPATLDHIIAGVAG